jgi:hypothetical protein
MNETYLSEGKAHRYLGVNKETLRRHRQIGNINGIDAGYMWLFSKSSLDLWKKNFYGGLKRRYVKEETATR